MTDLAPSGPWAKIHSGTWEYQITDNDVLWMARSVLGEGPQDAAPVMWTLTQKFGGIARWESLARFIRAYSQPVNPRWARGGEFCGPGGRYVDNALCSERLLDRRARVTSTTWQNMPDSVKQPVLAWARGQLPNPVPKAVDFAAPYLVEKRLAEDSRKRIVHKGGSWFITNARSNTWGPNHVRVGAAGDAAGSSSTWIWWLAGGALLAGVGYAVWRMR